MTSLLFGVVVLVIALAIGEFLYRWRSEPARFWGNLSQMLYAIGGIIVFGILILGLNGVGIYISAAVVVLYVWLARVRFDDVRGTDFRAMIGGR